MRDGAVSEIPAAGVVPGDVIHLAAGDLVPADGALAFAKDLFLNEAALTGESLPAEKHAAARVFRGTSVVWGVGTSVVVGIALPFTPLAGALGFAPLPPLFFAALLTMIVAYLALVEVVKRWFYRRYPM